MLNLEEVHKHVTGEGVSIAVLDSGHHEHPDLREDGLVEDFTSDGSPVDGNGHGTHVRGLIGMQSNGRGFVGVAPGATIHVAKVLDYNGVGSARWLENALTWVLDHDFDWCTGSLSMDSENERITRRIHQMRDKGIGCSFAAGNDFAKKVSFPASLAHCIATGAHDAAKIPANFSNIGVDLDILAPGVHVNSSWIDNNYKSASGSSMATPIVAGICALIIELERNFGA